MAYNRRIDIDIAKGIGILLVVFGHSISPVMGSNSLLNAIYTVIYSFHMPLFFFVSGYFSKKLLSCDDKLKSIKDKAQRLLIPYVAWAAIYLVLRVSLGRFARFEYSLSDIWTIALGNNPCGQMWFLYVLFVFSLVVILFINKRNVKILFAVAIAVSFFSPLYTPALSGISMGFSLLQLVFFVGGLIADEKTINLMQSKISLALAFILFVGYFTMKYAFHIDYWTLRLLPAVAGVVIVLNFGRRIEGTRISKPLSVFGEKSMTLYVLHSPFLLAMRLLIIHILKLQNPWVYIVSTSIVCVVGSLFVEKFIIKRIKILGVLLLGNKERK